MRIKEIIKEEGLTVYEVAERMNIKAPSLSRAINGNPTKEMLQRIADALEVHISELFVKPDKSASIICPNCGTEISIKVEQKQ